MSRLDPAPEAAALALSTRAPVDPWTLGRRQFLQAAVAGVAVGAMPGWLDGVAAAASPLGPTDGVLVLVIQDGGNDALDTVVPVADGAYQDLRGRIAIRPEQTLRVDDRRGLHPNLVNLHQRWAAGEVAVVDGVGLAETNLSHFSAMAEVMHGGPSSGVPRTGWAGRYLDGLGADPLHGVSIGRRVPLVITGATTSGTSLPGNQHGVRERKPKHEAIYRGLARMAGPTGLGALADEAAAVGAGMMDVSAQIRPLYPEPGSVGALAAKLALAAGLVNADLGIRVITVRHRGYDSHDDQISQHGARMAELDEALGLFDQLLAERFRSRSLVLCVSEFGRRAAANGSGGTDHGAAYSAIAVGAGVKGGFHGAPPSLTDLTRRGNLRPTVDHRHLSAAVVDRWLGGDAREIVGVEAAGLDFLRAPGSSEGGGGVRTGTFLPAHADVLRLYRAFFDREPDSAGARYWVGQYDRGMSLDAIAEAFTGSAEYQALYVGTTDEQYVAQVYRHVLGRQYDEAGYQYWLGLVRDGTLTRGRLVRVIAASQEFVARHPYDRMP